MKTMDFTMRFGKYKGQNFLNTPKSYQDWLLSQNWFNLPDKSEQDNTITSELTNIQREMSKVGNSLKGWNGYSRKGESAYDRMFELEKMESDMMYCNCGRLNEKGSKNCGWDCGY